MNLHYARVVDVFASEGARMGRVRVGGAMKTVSLDLLPDARGGDEVLLCDRVAISRMDGKNSVEEKNHVSGYSR